MNKLNILKKLDDIGMDYIECGWPGANPIDNVFFDSLPETKNSKLTAFGMTRRKNTLAKDDDNINRLINSSKYVCIVGKTWDYHVTDAINTTLEENLEIIKDSISYIISQNREAYFDAEHFFDGYKKNPQYALKCIITAFENGARWIVLCDTNGGTLPHEVFSIVQEVAKHIDPKCLAIHCHNDSGTAVASSLAAVQAGASQVQGTINGLGERCGNADLISVAINLELKMGIKTGIHDNINKLKSLSNYLYMQLNQIPPTNQPFVGEGAFAHKGGLHVSAVNKDPKFYEHLPPEKIGNKRKILLSNQSGKSNIRSIINNMGLGEKYNDSPIIDELLTEIKSLEDKGYAFDQAEASFRLIIIKKLKNIIFDDIFKINKTRLIDVNNISSNSDKISDMTIYMTIANQEHIEIAESKIGPVRAIDKALRKSITKYFPMISNLELADYQVKVIKRCSGSNAVIRALIYSYDKENKHTYCTVGVSDNILHASLLALCDSFMYKIIADKHNLS